MVAPPFFLHSTDMDSVKAHGQLRVYQAARASALRIYTLTIGFPADEKFEAANQIRRASRSVCSAIAEAWRWRFYPAKFTSKIIEAEGEAAEVQVWLDIAYDAGFISAEEHVAQHAAYDAILGQLVRMRLRANTWGAVNPSTRTGAAKP